ncbi:MAG: hypothetical protein AB1555_06585 [Nitrospirota bacterium]
MIDLDGIERAALDRLAQLIKEEKNGTAPIIDEPRVFRRLNGEIVVPVIVQAAHPDMSLALLMAHKAEQLYRQTGCRFVPAQRPAQDPEKATYIWADGGWQTLP